MQFISREKWYRFSRNLPLYFQGFVPKFFRVFKENYTFSELRRDITAGVTVAIVALPLSMALAIASGTTPDRGLFTAIVAGFLISLLGGSRFQIGGPTGAFVVVIYNIIATYGYNGLALATIMAGLMLILAGFFRLGALIKYIPYPVVTGFTAGIAVIIFSSQIKDLFGLQIDSVPAEIIEKWQAFFAYKHTFDPASTAIALSTLAVMLLLRKFAPRLPNFLIGVVVGAVAVYALHLPVDTIGSKFGGIPDSLPTPSFPTFSWEELALLFPSAFTIAFLAGIESLLSAVVADGMTGDRHLSNCELVAEGTANVASVLFGGIPATGAIARTATNIRAGAYSPVSGMIHAVALLLFMVFLAPLASFVPLAGLAAVLVIVAWNMSGFDKIRLLMSAQMGDRLTMIVTFLLTVFVDLNTAIEVGVVMASLIFMHRMSVNFAVESDLRLTDEHKHEMLSSTDFVGNLPDGVVAFRISGPLFFGAASRLTEFFDTLPNPPKIIILRMGSVPMMDATAVNILVDFIKQCRERKTKIIVSNAKDQPRKVLKMEIIKRRLNTTVAWAARFRQALSLSERLIEDEESKKA
ncbi:MAG TPA: sodium-independent anion transporter [Alphaproteobacteria bacterium]|nr:sodium-independent anion transporter [Alphaproteobacteria bacterium]